MKYLLCVLSCLIWVGCGGRGAPPAAKATPQAVLAKALLLQEWGFLDTAENWYRKLSEPAYPDKVRYEATQALLKILENRRKEEELAVAREDAIKAFPQQGADMRRKLLEYYMATWQWPKAKTMLMAMLEKDSLPDRTQMTELRKSMENWEQRPLQWKEDFSEPLDWLMAPVFHCYRNAALRQLQLITVAGSWHHAGTCFQWDGCSTILKFDIRITKIEWTGNISVGIFSPYHRNYRLLTNFACGGGTGDYHYSFSLEGVTENAASLRRNTLLEYTPGNWYTVQVDYLQPLRRAALQVWQKGNKSPMGEQIILCSQEFPAGKYMIGLAPLSKEERHPSIQSHAMLDNIELYGTGWQKYRGDLPLQDIYDINSLFPKQPKEALQKINALLQQQPENWQMLEMRAYLWQAAKQGQKYLADLRQVLTIYPQHPNHDLLELILKGN